MNAHYMVGAGRADPLVIPKEGAMLGIDTVAIMKGSKKRDLAYKFINALLDPQMQAEVATLKKGSPVVTQRQNRSGIAKLPGVFTTPDQWSSRRSSSTPSCARKRPRSGANGLPRTS